MGDKLQETLTLAELLRETGNSRYRLGDLAGARRDYEECLKLLESVTALGNQDLHQRIGACRRPAQLNVAQCCLRAEPCEAQRALELCDEVLEEEPENAKASYRRAKALMALDRLHDAELQLVRACSLAPGDGAVRKDLEALRRQRRQQQQQQQRREEEEEEARRDAANAKKEAIQIQKHHEEKPDTTSSTEDDLKLTTDTSPGSECFVTLLEQFKEEEKERQQMQNSASQLASNESVASSPQASKGGKGQKSKQSKKKQAAPADGEADDAWLQIEADAESVRRATERHAELWKELQVLLKERDVWSTKLKDLHDSVKDTVALEGQLECKKLVGHAAVSKSKQCFAASRAYAATERRARKLNQQVLNILQEIRSIEQDPKVRIDPQDCLDDAMREAVMRDDPSQVETLLASLPNRMSSRRVDDIIQKRPDLSIVDLKRKIKDCEQKGGQPKKESF